MLYYCQAFQQFDSEGDGTADVGAMLEALRASNGASMYGELGHVVRTLQACSLTPGFIDVYSEDKQTIGQHGTRILNVSTCTYIKITSLSRLQWRLFDLLQFLLQTLRFMHMTGFPRSLKSWKNSGISF